MVCRFPQALVLPPSTKHLLHPSTTPPSSRFVLISTSQPISLFLFFSITVQFYRSFSRWRIFRSYFLLYLDRSSCRRCAFVCGLCASFTHFTFFSNPFSTSHKLASCLVSRRGLVLIDEHLAPWLPPSTLRRLATMHLAMPCTLHRTPMGEPL